jgi:hypothetical protein
MTGAVILCFPTSRDGGAVSRSQKLVCDRGGCKLRAVRWRIFPAGAVALCAPHAREEAELGER